MKKGFTLIEVLVSTAIFSVVVVMALGALLAMSTSDRKAETLKSVINNVDFAVDSMTRAMRTGVGWECGTVSGTIPSAVGDCLSGANVIVFTPAGGVSGARVAYQLDTSSPTCGQTGTIGCIERDVYNGSSWSGWVPITSPEVVITNTTLFGVVVGTKVGSADDIQPRATLMVSGYVLVTATQQTQFHMETSVTQRLYDQ